MRILALDTATPTASLALLDGSTVLAEWDGPPGETHSRTLLPAVRDLLAGPGWAVADLDLLAVDMGPGSFTGLRIGLAVAKGLAWGADRPLVGVSSLDILAAGVPAGARGVWPIIDARHGQVYTACYQPGPPGHPLTYVRVGEAESLTIAALVERIEEGITLVGDGLLKWERELAARLGPRFRRSPKELDRPRAAALARMCEHYFLSGAESRPALIIPWYVRPPDIWKSGGKSQTRA